jgi:hypothetical protein
MLRRKKRLNPSPSDRDGGGCVPALTTTVSRTSSSSTEQEGPTVSGRSELPKVFQPSTMASRRAEREARGELERPRRLVTLGWRTEHLPPAGTTGEFARWRDVQYELLFDRDRPGQMFVRYTREGAVEPIVRYHSEGNRVLARETIPMRPPRGKGGQSSTKTIWRSDEPD